MKIKRMKSILWLTIFIYFITACSTQKKIVCSDGNIVMVQKNPNESYQQIATVREANLKTSINILDKIKLSDISIGLKKDVVRLRDTLNNYASITEDLIKTSFIDFNNHPCDTSIRSEHYKLLNAISKQNVALITLSSKLTSIYESGNISGINESEIKQTIERYYVQEKKDLFKK